MMNFKKISWAISLVSLTALVACQSNPSKTTVVTASKPSHSGQHCTILDGYTKQDETMLGPPLVFAASSNNLDQAQCLLKSGHNVNALDGVGMTALLKAIGNQNGDMVNLLLDYGADPNAGKDLLTGKKALDLAEMKGNKSIILMLQAKSATSDTSTAKQEAAEMQLLDKTGHNDLKGW